MQLLVPLLDTLDKFNRLASGVEKEDAEDLSWPGIIGIDFFFFFLISLKINYL